MTTPASIQDQAAGLLLKVQRDGSLSLPIRRAARRVNLRASEPALAVRALQQLAAAQLPNLPRVSPSQALARVTTAATFHRWYSRPEIRDGLLTTEDFVNHANNTDNIAAFLNDCLSANDPIFGWDRSWLAPLSSVRGLPADEILRVLEMPGRGPLVMFTFELEDLLAAGVTVRAPNALDSALGPNYQWNESGLTSGIPEFVDGDLPRAALTKLGWVR